MMTRFVWFDHHFYLCGSRLATHISFWAIYYVSFGLIWMKPEEGLFNAFFLEFVLLPARLAAVYVMIYWLLPNVLLTRYFQRFLAYYIAMLLVVGLIQVVAYYYFYLGLLYQQQDSFWDLSLYVRSIMLVNSTVIFVSAVKLLQLHLNQTDPLTERKQHKIEVRANRRTYLVEPHQILYLEGMGNYVSYHLLTREKLVSHGTIKQALEKLPSDFLRLHKSYVVNLAHIDSFSSEDVVVKGTALPRGKDISDQSLQIKPAYSQ